MTDTNWNRRVWRLAGPIILANLAVPLLGAVDTAVMGHLPGPQYIGAVAVGAETMTPLRGGIIVLGGVIIERGRGYLRI